MTSGDRVAYRTSCPRCRAKGRDRSGDNFAVYLDGHSYCFSCHYLIPAPSIERLKAESRKSRESSMNENDLNFPDDYTPLLDALHAKIGFHWIRKYGITDDEIIKFKIGWSMDRLLLIYPIYDTDNKLIMWQGRNFGEGEKYLTYGPKRDTLHTVGRKDRQVIIVTEDLISAIVVGRQYQAAPLWGSEMSLGLIKKVASSFSILGIWLDPNKVTKSVEIALRASQYIPTFIVDSGMDPKLYNQEHIVEFIEAAGYQQYYKEEVRTKELKPKEDTPVLDSLEAKGFSNWKKVMNNVVANQPCVKCAVKSPEIKSICTLRDCPYFTKHSCVAGKECRLRQCESCLKEYSELCKINAPMFNPETGEHEWGYSKDEYGS